MCQLVSLKRQVPRLRDWNLSAKRVVILRMLPWNDKYLDYEIETNKQGRHDRNSLELETTSTSITRLKLAIGRTQNLTNRILKRQVPRLRDWNISIRCLARNALSFHLKRQVPRLRDWNNIKMVVILSNSQLETTSTSITRLKQRCQIGLILVWK